MRNFMFKERTWLWSSILVKKTKITKFALTRSLRNGDCLKIFLLAFCFFGNFFFFLVFFGGGWGEGVVESLFIVNLQAFLVKPHIILTNEDHNQAHNTFWRFSKVSSHHKCNKEWLLVINTVCKSCFTSSRTTYEFLGNYEISGKSQNFIELVPSAYYYSWNENFVGTSKNLLKNRTLTFPLVRCSTWKLELVWDILWMIAAKKHHQGFECKYFEKKNPTGFKKERNFFIKLKKVIIKIYNIHHIYCLANCLGNLFSGLLERPGC